jgi:AcrR family transcriptional regulator
MTTRTSPRSAPARARRLSSDDRQREIVSAVLALAREMGPDAITTHAIAAHMGLTQGAIFRHFPDKAAIWLAVFAWVRAGLDEALTAALARADPHSPVAQLEAAFRAHVGFVARHPGVARVLFHELQYPGDSPVRAEVRRMIARYRARLGRLFRAARAAGELPVDLDPALASVLFIGAVQGLVIDAALAGNDTAMARRAAPTFRLLLDGYRGPAPVRRA